MQSESVVAVVLCEHNLSTQLVPDSHQHYSPFEWNLLHLSVESPVYEVHGSVF